MSLYHLCFNTNGQHISIFIYKTKCNDVIVCSKGEVKVHDNIFCLLILNSWVYEWQAHAALHSEPLKTSLKLQHSKLCSPFFFNIVQITMIRSSSVSSESATPSRWAMHITPQNLNDYQIFLCQSSWDPFSYAVTVNSSSVILTFLIIESN